MKPWETVELSEVADLTGGHAFKSSEYSADGMFILRTLNIRDDCSINPADAKFIPHSLVPAYERFSLKDDDTLFVMVGATLGKVGRIRVGDLPALLNQNMWRIRAKKGRIHPIYLHYCFRHFCKGPLDWMSGSARGFVRRDDYRKLGIPLPDASEQAAIAALLGALDDKIELNRRMSATLEETARALYRSWFVDFDPVHARALGQPPAHMDPTTATLFPDSFGADGLPKGWEWAFFEDHYKVLETGKRPKGGVSSISEGVPSIGAESIKNIGHFDFSKTKLVPRDFFAAMRKGHLRDGDILIYKDGGKPGELRPAATYISKGFPFAEACINEHVFRVRLSHDLGQHFGFLAISSDHCMNQMRELATGVAQPGLNQSAMKALSFLMPSKVSLLRRFEELVTPFLDGCNERAKESQNLAALRDTLLPRLMSGELRIREAEKQVEEVV